MAKRTYKSKSQTRRKGYNPNRTVNSTFARETRKNAEALKIGGSVGGIVRILGAGLEPKHKGRKKVTSVLRKTSKSTVSRGGGISKSKKTKTITGLRKGGRGGGSGGGGWATIDGRRIPLGG